MRPTIFPNGISPFSRCPLQFLQHEERKRHWHRPFGQATNIGRKTAFRLPLDHIRVSADLAGQCPRITGRNTSSQFDRRIGLKRFLQAIAKLAKILVRQDHPHLILSSLAEDNADVFIKIVLSLIHIDKAGQPVEIRQGGAFLGGLGDQGYEEPPEHFSALFLQKRLGGVDQDQLAVVHFGKHVELGLGVGEHPFEGLVFEDTIQAAQDLSFGGGKFLAVEFGFEETAGGHV